MIIKYKSPYFFFSCLALIHGNHSELKSYCKNRKKQVFLDRQFNLHLRSTHGFLYFSFQLTIKNLLKLFKKRRTKLKNRRFYLKCLRGWRLKINNWFDLQRKSRISFRFNLPLLKGSKDYVKSLEREDIVWELVNSGDLEDFTSDYFYNNFLKYNFQMFCIRFFEKRRLFLKGRLFITRIRATRNNIFFTFSFINGKTLITMSAGRSDFSGKKKRTPLAAKKTASRFAKKVNKFLEKHFKGEALFFINLKGPVVSSLFKESLLAFKEEFLPCNLIVDKKSVAHSRGLRLKKPRRV